MLTVRDGELSTDDTPCCMVSWLRVSGQRAACAMKFGIGNPTFYGYIQVLLIKPNSMVYICYIKYKIKYKIWSEFRHMHAHCWRQ